MRSLPVRPVTASDSECGAPSARAEIDATDLAIIQILQDDGRTSFTSIAKQLNISEGAVRNRVSQLTDSRVLKVIGVANPIALLRSSGNLDRLHRGSSGARGKKAGRKRIARGHRNAATRRSCRADAIAIAAYSQSHG